MSDFGQAKQAQVVIDFATVVVPFTKASTLNKGLKVADGLADLSKLETSTVKLTRNALKTGEISELKYIMNADNSLDLSLKMKVESPRSTYAQQPQLNVPTQITPKVTIQPLEQPTPISKIKAAEHTLVEISKDALNKGEMVLKQGKELELTMPLKPRERGLTPMEDSNFKLRADMTDQVLQRPEKRITFATENPSPLSFKETQFKDVLQEAGLSEKEFQRLNLTSIEKYTAQEIEQMKLMRERVPKITEDTLLHKTIPEESIEKILSGDPRSQNVGGYIARAEDVQHIINYDEVFEILRLDYDQTPFLEGKNSYGLIKFKVEKAETVTIPYSKVKGTNFTYHLEILMSQIFM